MGFWWIVKKSLFVGMNKKQHFAWEIRGDVPTHPHTTFFAWGCVGRCVGWICVGEWDKGVQTVIPLIAWIFWVCSIYSVYVFIFYILGNQFYNFNLFLPSAPGGFLQTSQQQKRQQQQQVLGDVILEWPLITIVVHWNASWMKLREQLSLITEYIIMARLLILELP
jgi:TM2 domain-containing membrane protein YozV